MSCGSFAKSFSYLDKISLFYSLVNIFWWLHRVLAFPESFWTKEALMFVLQKWNAASDVLVGALQVKKTPKPLEWTSRLDLWTGSLDWSSGLALWTGPLDWLSRLVLWAGPLDWSSGLVLWTGPLDWPSGLALWTGPLDWPSELVLWTGPLD